MLEINIVQQKYGPMKKLFNKSKFATRINCFFVYIFLLLFVRSATFSSFKHLGLSQSQSERRLALPPPICCRPAKKPVQKKSLPSIWQNSSLRLAVFIKWRECNDCFWLDPNWGVRTFYWQKKRMGQGHFPGEKMKGRRLFSR